MWGITLSIIGLILTVYAVIDIKQGTRTKKLEGHNEDDQIFDTKEILRDENI